VENDGEGGNNNLEMEGVYFCDTFKKKSASMIHIAVAGKLLVGDS
jgi:hypothetical protein